MLQSSLRWALPSVRISAVIATRSCANFHAQKHNAGHYYKFNLIADSQNDVLHHKVKNAVDDTGEIICNNLCFRTGIALQVIQTKSFLRLAR